MKVEPIFFGKTFDDFLLRPQRGVAPSRKDVDLTSKLSRNYELSLPILSANMDSVTGSMMAKTMALEGGAGFVHRGMSIADQEREVSQVKRSHRYIVEKPLCLPPNATIRETRPFTRRQHNTGRVIVQTRVTHI